MKLVDYRLTVDELLIDSMTSVNEGTADGAGNWPLSPLYVL